MGEIVMAAKVTHVPSLLISERPGPLYGSRDAAIAGLKEIGRRCEERGVDTYLVFDTHWLSNFGCHMNAKARHKGTYTSHEAPHMIQNLEYDYPGDTQLGNIIAAESERAGVEIFAHQIETLPLEYGTIVPMRYMNAEGRRKVVSVASPLFASVDENRRFGEAARRAILASGRKVAVIASGSLSHKLIANNEVGDDQWDSPAPEFNRQMDIRVLQMWEERRYAEFCRMLPDYSTKCNGEALMSDTHMLFGLLGWDGYTGKTEIISPYFPSSGAGQINAEFHL